MELTNILLALISGLLTIIGVFMVKFYDRFERLVEDFHNATVQIARHDERIDQLEEHMR